MKILQLLAVFALCRSAAQEEQIIELTKENFDHTILENEVLFVEFYSNSCGESCQDFVPRYKTVAENLLKLSPPIRVAKVNLDGVDVEQKYNIQKLPTFLLFRKNVDPEDTLEYRGDLLPLPVTEWIIKYARHPVHYVETQQEVDHLTQSNEIVVLVYLSDKQDPKQQLITQIASAEASIQYAVTTTSGVGPFGRKSAPALTMLKSFDDPQVDFEDDFTKSKIKEFVQDNRFPLIRLFDMHEANENFHTDLKTNLLLFSDASKEYHEPFMKCAEKVARKQRKYLVHVHVPPSEIGVYNFVGVNADYLPSVRLVNTSEGMVPFAYHLRGEALVATFGSTCEDDLIEFEQKFFQHTLQQSSEPVDDTNNVVKTIVALDFQERVLDSQDQDVLIYFGDPWVDACEAFDPIYALVGENFATKSSIMIAEVDVTDNPIKIPGITLKNYPLLVFFPKQDKQNPIVYTGKYELKEVTSFIHEHAQPEKRDEL